MKRVNRSSLLLTCLAMLAATAQAQDTPPAESTGLTRPVVVPGGRTSPPPPATPRPVTVPAPAVRTLANGLRVIVVPRPGSGLVTVQMLVRSGGAVDPDNKGGLANMTASLLTQGARGRTAPQFAEAVEALGTSVEAGAGWDGSYVTMNVIRTRLAQALPLFADVVLAPTFAPAEIERLRTQTLDELSVNLRDPGTLARYTGARALYGAAPYGHPLGGTPETLRAIRRADIAGYHRTNYRPDNASLLVVGDITAADAFALASRQFGGWQKPSGALPRPAASASRAAAGKQRVVIVDKPDAGQAAVYLTRLGITRNDPAYIRGTVANAVLGTGFSSRLNREIRIKRGLSYGAGSRLDGRRMAGPFIAASQTKNPTAGEVAALIVAEMRQLGAGPLPATELDSRKAVLTGDFSRSLETASGLTGRIAELELYGLPLSSLNSYLPAIRGVSAAQVKTFATQSLSPKAATVVIVGDAKQFLPDLKKRMPGVPVEIIPAARLDLNRASLKKG